MNNRVSILYRADNANDVDGHPSFWAISFARFGSNGHFNRGRHTKKENGRLNNIGVDGMEKEDIIIYSKE